MEEGNSTEINLASTSQTAELSASSHPPNHGLTIDMEEPPSTTNHIEGVPTTPSLTMVNSASASSIAGSASYVSPASSTTSHRKHTPGSYYTSPAKEMTTIDNASPAPARKDSDDIMNIPPAHPFFHQQYYDSDASDGSLVQKRGRKGSGSSNRQPNERDRFPSFDSLGSNGSVLYVNPAASGPPKPNPATPIDAHMLPYHERRKLMQQRERQQQLQQQQYQQQHNKQPPVSSSHHHVPPPYRAHHGQGDQGYYMQPTQGSPYMPQQQRHTQQQKQPPPNPQQQQQQYQQMHPQMHPHYAPLPPHDPASAAAYNSWYGMPPNMAPYYANPQQSGNTPPGFPPVGYPGYPPHGYPPHSAQQGQRYPPNAYSPAYGIPTSVDAKPPQHPSAAAPSQPTQQQPLRSSPTRTAGKQSRPPTGKTPSLRPPISGPPSASKPPAAAPAPGRAPLPLSGSSTEASSESKPPPPPSMPPPSIQQSSSNDSSQYHIQTDSFGSMSSLGSFNSQGAHNGIDDHEAPKHGRGHRRDNSSGSLMDLLRFQWNPPGQPPSPAESFHKKSQDFLQQQQRQTNAAPAAPAPVAPPTQRHRTLSQDRPPASRGTHKRLPSISNDDWEESLKARGEKPAATSSTPSGEISASAGYSSCSDPEEKSGDDKGNDYADNSNEQTALLPPTGISSNERDEARQASRESRHARRQRRERSNAASSSSGRDYKQRSDKRSGAALVKVAKPPEEEPRRDESRRKHRKKSKKNRKSSRHYRPRRGSDGSGEGDQASYDYREWTQKRARMLEKERSKYIALWKEEARAEAENNRRESERRALYEDSIATFFKATWHSTKLRTYKFLTSLEAFIANLPLTIGAVAMAIVTLGVVWFKFSEENLDYCEPVHFHSSQCTFPEFPGCFYCDTSAKLYKVALTFHFGCKITAGFLAMLFVLKVLLAGKVVADEMSSPTTASPAGLLCMTTVCVFAGRGVIGQVMVTAAAFVHLGIVGWFIYMVLAYHIMPEPSWFPNTVGVGLTAVKTWLYYPIPGHFLMAISLALNFFFFPISLIRVGINEKISATVGWMQMSAPAISLYALTIMAQPSFEEEHPDVTTFQRVHRMIYLPCMHFMCALSILGFFASCHSLWTRWHDFRKKEFSPAHAAFCFPLLSHANGVQAYRGAIISFSDIHPHSWRMIVLYIYWLIVLFGGTIATFWITAKYLYNLPQWTNIDLSDEEEPPAPSETILSLQHIVDAGEVMRQPFVSPAVLQANETGALVLTRSGPQGQLRYVRTRRLAALGFEPTMNWAEMQHERDVLLDWVGKHPPRRRHRTLSVPGVDFNYGSNDGTDNSGVYGATATWDPRSRADTGSPTAYY